MNRNDEQVQTEVFSLRWTDDREMQLHESCYDVASFQVENVVLESNLDGRRDRVVGVQVT